MAVELLGCTEPRVFTPPKRELTPETSLGFAVIEFAGQLLGLRLYPWQKWLFIHALELNPDGLYRFRTVVIEIARQNGKTKCEIILALFHLYVLMSGTVIGTAQNLDNAEKAWKEAVSLAQSNEELAELIPKDSPYFGHPKNFMIVHNEDGRETTSEYRVTADGRGFSGDLILLDELREHKSWDAWAAVTNTMNARPKGQCWAFSNAPNAFGVVLRYQRALAHKELGWPDDDEDIQGAILGEIDALPEFEDMPEVEFDTGFFEWSMAPGLPRNHPQGLMQANPSANHTDVSENCPTYRTLISALRNSPAHVAEAEICCRETTVGVGGPFPEGSWTATGVDEAHRDDAKRAAGSKIVVCVEVSTKREQTFIAIAGHTECGDATVGIREDRAGTDWVLDYLVENRKNYALIVIRSAAGAPVVSLLKSLQDARLPVVEWKGEQIAAGHSQMFDRLRDKRIKHLAHRGLDMAATSAEVRVASNGAFVVDAAKSPTDTAALFAAIGAVWGLDNAEVKRPQVHGWDMAKVEEWKKKALER